MQPSESKAAEATGTGFGAAIGKLSGFFGALAALAIVGILLLVCAEIAMRNLLGRSTMISDEVAGYLNAAAVFLSLGYTLREGAFIRVDTLYAKFRGRPLLAARWVFTAVTLVFVGLLLYYLVAHVVYLYASNIRSDSLSQTPLYIPESVLVIGTAVLLLQLVTYVVKKVRDVP